MVKKEQCRRGSGRRTAWQVQDGQHLSTFHPLAGRPGPLRLRYTGFCRLAVGAISSLVAAAVDREPGRNATIAVTATNMAGVAPFVMELLMSGETMSSAVCMINDVFVLVVMYGTAAIGWALVLGMPKVAAVYISVSNDAKSQAMRREQRRLIEDWGQAVTEAPAPGRKRRPNSAASPV